MISSLKSYFNKITNLAPLRRIKEIAVNLLDRCTGGRGLKIWAKPRVRPVKSHGAFHEFVLDNGLRVIAKQSKGKQVSASLHIKSGAMKDPKGKEGLAHLLEHLVCSKTVEFGDKVSKIADINGGYSNANTNLNKTSYDLILPKEKLDLTLRILAAYMRDLKIDETELNSEKNIIDRENLMHKSSPIWELRENINKILYGENSLFCKDLLGDKKSLGAISLTDLQAFKEAEYCPNNTVLEISGDFELPQLKQKLEQHFAPLKRNPKHQEIKDPGMNGSPEKEHKFKVNLTQAGVELVHKSNKFNLRERAIAELIIKSLDSKTGKRLYHKLINIPDPLITSFTTEMVTDKYHSLIGCSLSILPNKYNPENVKRLREIIDAEIKDIAQNGLKAEEVNELITSHRNQEESKKDRQHSDMHAVTSTILLGENNWEEQIDPAKLLETISQDEIKAFANKYLIENPAICIQTDPIGTTTTKTVEQVVTAETEKIKQKAISIEEFRELKAISGGLVKPSIEIPATETRVLANGSTVLFMDDKNSKTFNGTIDFEDGFVYDPNIKKEQVEMLVELIGKLGIYHRKTDRHLDHIALQKIGIKQGFNAGFAITENRVILNFDGLARNNELLMQFADRYVNDNAILALDKPEIRTKAEQELAKIKKITVDEIKANQKYGGNILARTFFNAIYPEGHINHKRSVEEKIKNINAISLEDLQKIYQRFFFQKKKARVYIRGNCNKDAICDSLNRTLAGMQSRATADAQIVPTMVADTPAPLRKGLQIINSKKPDKQNSTIVLGNPHDIRTTEKDGDIAFLVNAYVGGSHFNSKLMQKLRTEKELVYGIESRYQTTATHSKPFIISLSCRPNHSKEAIATVIRTLKETLAKGISPEELEYFKHEHLNGWHTSVNSKQAVLNSIMAAHRQGRDISHLENYPQYIESITVEDFNRVMRRLIKPEQLVCIVEKPANSPQGNEELAFAA